MLEFQKLTRGVYWEAATKNGHPQAFAVDSTGDEIERHVVKNFSWRKGEATVGFLWRVLNNQDPATQLVRVHPLFVLPAPVQPTIDPYDPYAVEGVPGHLRRPW